MSDSNATPDPSIKDLATDLLFYQQNILEEILPKKSYYLKRLRQIADLVIVQFLMLVTFFVCLYNAFYEPRIYVPVIGVVGLVIRYFYEVSQRRLGSIDAVSADILSIGRVFVSATIIDDFGKLAFSEEKVPHGFADEARKEDYLSVYVANTKEINELGSQIVREITSFYTFLKISRDATRAIANWNRDGYTNEFKQKDVATIIYQCLLCFIHGQRALNLMISDNSLRSYSSGLFLHLQGQALEYLKEFKFDSYRSGLIETRWKRFEKIRESASKTSWTSSATNTTSTQRAGGVDRETTTEADGGVSG